MSAVPESVARAIFRAAIAEARCGELLDCLFGGGSATVDAGTGKLMLLPQAQIRGLLTEE